MLLLLLLLLLQVFLTPTHLCIVMEYAAGGELFDRIVKAGRFSEDEARYFFQQLICGVDYCHQSVRGLTWQGRAGPGRVMVPVGVGAAMYWE